MGRIRAKTWEDLLNASLRGRPIPSGFAEEVLMVTFNRFVQGLTVCLVILLFAFPLMAAPIGGQTAGAAPLTNDDIIKMVQFKFGDNVIVAKIKSSPCKFDTSMDALTKLKAAGVSDAVMQAMMEPGAPGVSNSSAAPAGPPPDPNDPNAEHDPGIYYVRQNPGGRRMTALDPTAYSGTKTGGMFTSAMTYGIHKAKQKAVVRGGRANVRITEELPTFYFYFEAKHGTLSNSGGLAGWFGGLSTPNQFSLVKLESDKDSRTLVVGEFGAFGASSGTRNKDVTEFDFTKVSPGIYKVVPRAALQPGEYCFFYTGQNTAMGAGGGNLFDFGINPAE
jgi:hypothetical protein